MMIREMLLEEIVELHKLKGDEMVRGISCNSEEIKPGEIFFALKGARQDGSRFLEDAVKRGAMAGVVSELKSIDIPQVVVRDVNKAFGIACSRLYNEASRRLTVAGITGTNGKTTITYMIESVLNSAGEKCGVIGTTGYRYPGVNITADLTTPDAKRLNQLLQEMVLNGVRVVAMEVSSHALEMGRVWGIDFDVAAFTNLTQDHLDFHKTMDNYFKSKEKLFNLYLPASRKGKLFGVINNDDPYGRRIEIKDGRIKKVTYGIESSADIRAIEINEKMEGSEFLISFNDMTVPVRVNLAGRHNIYNALATFGICIAIGIGIRDIARGIENLRIVPGRLEPVPNNYGIRVFIDYAHTPDALKHVIGELKRTSTGRLITIFGCGGDRDRGKRPLMGEIAGSISDITIITSDNPRTEDPLKIINEIEAGISKLGIKKGLEPKGNVFRKDKFYTTIPDREEAIRTGLRIAEKGDTVLIAGKGHEDYQIIGTEKRSFSDKEVVLKFLRDRESKDSET